MRYAGVDAARRHLLTMFGAASSAALLGCGGGKAGAAAATTLPNAAPAPAQDTTPAPADPVTASPAPAPAAAPTPSAIEANIWTPARDSLGSVVSADIQTLTPNVWYLVGDSQSILASALQVPHYPKPRESGVDGSTGIVAAWGGAAWDYTTQTMYISGGGHGDTHECDTGVYALKAATLRFERVVDRQPLAQFQWYDTINSTPGHAVFGDDPAFGAWGMNSPLKNGVPTSFHTYNGLVWIPPVTMQAIIGRSNSKGGLFYPGTCRAVINLDDQSYSTSHFLATPDFSYQIAMLDGKMIFGPRASFYYYRFDLTQHEVTDWPGGTTLSQGKFLSGTTSTVEFTYNNKCFCWMRERREAVSFAGDQHAVRLRYGAAIDAGASDWSSYHDPIVLTSANGSDHLDFSSANLQDTGTNLLCEGGAFYDDAAGCIWVQSNTVGGSFYQITGLAASTWTVRKVSGAEAIVVAPNGTFGRFTVATIGTSKLAIRVTDVSGPIQVMRLA